MFKLLSKLQDKPERQRKRITLISSFVIIFIILGLWLTSLFSGQGTVIEEFQEEENVASPLSSLGGCFK